MSEIPATPVRQAENEQRTYRPTLNPRYGSGCFRRAIQLVPVGSHVLEAALEDDAHAFALTLRHDGKLVTALEGRALRFPLSTCGGALAPLEALVGAPLASTARDLQARADPRANCTHLHDLALLAIAHAAQAPVATRYRIAIPDARRGRTTGTLERDGSCVLEWHVEDGVIGAPAPYAGQNVLGGFGRWARATLDGEELRHALLLQRGFFVARSRMYDMEAGGEQRAARHPMPAGACYSYSPGQVEHALGVSGSRRDFSTRAEELLRWT